MEVKQMPSSNKAKRGNLKSRERLPLQDKTNTVLKGQNNAMVRKQKPTTNLENSDKESETIKRGGKAKNDLNDRKEQPQTRGVARGAKKSSEGPRLVEKPEKSEVTTSGCVSRLRTRNDSKNVAEGCKIGKNLTAKEQNNVDEVSNVVTGRQIGLKGDSNSKLLPIDREAVLLDIERRSSFVSLEKSIEDIVTAVKERNVSDKRTKEPQKADKDCVKIIPDLTTKVGDDEKLNPAARLKTGKNTAGLGDKIGKNKTGAIIPEENQPNKRNATNPITIATTLENNQIKTRTAKKQTKISEFVAKDATKRFLRPKKPPKDTVKTDRDEKTLPIYNQVRKSPENFVDNVYDFDSDSEEVNQKKGKRKQKKVKTSIGYDKDMDKVVEELDKKFKRTTRKRPAKKKKMIPKSSRKAIPTTQKEILTIQKEVLTTSGKEIPTTFQREMPTTQREILTTSPREILTTSWKDIPTTSRGEIPTTSRGEIPTTSRGEIPTTSRRGIPTISYKEIPTAQKEVVPGKSIPVIFIDDFHENSSQDCVEISDEEPEIRNLTSNVVSPNKTFDFDEPVANSTMLNFTRNDPQASPWRSNLNVMRNPHFLRFKESFLPNYNQQMILDSSIVERIAPRSVEKSINRSPKQASILRYIDGKEIEVMAANTTLFDDNQFSPIKEQAKENFMSGSKKNSLTESKKNSLTESKKNSLSECQKGQLSESVNSGDKENSFEVKQKRKVDRAKRKILGPVVDNQQIVGNSSGILENSLGIRENSSGILGNSPEIGRKSPGISDCFGFDDSVDVVEDRQNKPVRMDKIHAVMQRKNQVIDVFDIEDNSVRIEENAADEGVGLFEDYQPERTLENSTLRQYVVKKKRQRRCRSPSPYSDESDDEGKHHRKKRNKRTKKEEDEAEKWAAAFNSMCEEVEKFPLEIE